MESKKADFENVTNMRLRLLVCRQIREKIAWVQRVHTREELRAIADSFDWEAVRQAASERLFLLEDLEGLKLQAQRTVSHRPRAA